MSVSDSYGDVCMHLGVRNRSPSENYIFTTTGVRCD